MSLEKNRRHFVRNFFVKRQMQVMMTLQILLAVILAAAITVVVLVTLYYYRSGSGYFYFMSRDLMEEMQRFTIAEVILPGLLIAEIVSVVLGAMIGFFASRKLAVPVYKMEMWVLSILKKNFKEKIIFREKDVFKTLCKECNHLSETLDRSFCSLQKELEEVEKESSEKDIKEKIKKIRESLAKPWEESSS